MGKTQDVFIEPVLVIIHAHISVVSRSYKVVVCGFTKCQKRTIRLTIGSGNREVVDDVSDRVAPPRVSHELVTSSFRRTPVSSVFPRRLTSVSCGGATPLHPSKTPTTLLLSLPDPVSPLTPCCLLTVVTHTNLRGTVVHLRVGTRYRSDPRDSSVFLLPTLVPDRHTFRLVDGNKNSRQIINTD